MPAPRAGPEPGTPTESLRHWGKVRELTDALPESEETTALGLAARIFLLQYGWRLGITHEEAEQMFAEAERMASQVRRHPTLARSCSRSTAASAASTTATSRRWPSSGPRRLPSPRSPTTRRCTWPLAGTSYGTSWSATTAGCGDSRSGDGAGRRRSHHGGRLTVGCPLGYCLIFKGGCLPPWVRWTRASLLERGMTLCREQGDMETFGWGHMWSFWLAYYAGEHR